MAPFNNVCVSVFLWLLSSSALVANLIARQEPAGSFLSRHFQINNYLKCIYPFILIRIYINNSQISDIFKYMEDGSFMFDVVSLGGAEYVQSFEGRETIASLLDLKKLVLHSLFPWRVTWDI
jgi:hypothetical protein